VKNDYTLDTLRKIFKVLTIELFRFYKIVKKANQA